MNKNEAIELLQDLYQEQQRDAEYYDGNFEYMDFITVYFNIDKNKELKWCNTVNDAIDVVNKLPDNAKIAVEIGDDLNE